MYYEPYAAGQLRVAYCHRVYFRFQTYRRLPQACLDELRKSEFQELLEPYGIRLLDVASDDTDLVCQVSLRPDEAVCACASKFKGRLSKWLRTAQGRDAPATLLAKGYFASTVGDPTSREILGYIERQGEHHGYTARPLPPVFSETYAAPADDTTRLDAAHNVSLLRFHFVFGTVHRKGIFTRAEAARVAAVWRGFEAAQQFALLKVSFVPDHVHVAARVHPAVKPLALAAELMSAGQAVMFEEFPEIMIRYGSNQLWETGAYIGSFGDVNSNAVRAALRRWCSWRDSV